MKRHSDLKAWVRWAKRQPLMGEEQPLFIKAIEDVISQAGEAEVLKARVQALEAHLKTHPTACEIGRCTCPMKKKA